jgi:outer membrane protein OmpA-like peptidoglycan-associated protein
VDEGLPAASVFAAAFGAQQPVANNADTEGRARNRRVEMAPVAQPSRTVSEAGSGERSPR